MFFFGVNRFDKLKVVKAGEAGKVLPLHKEIDKHWWDSLNMSSHDDDYFNEVGGKDIFVVIGESMAPEYIHTGDLLFVSIKKQCDSLKERDLIVLKIDKNRCRQEHDLDCELGYKLRMFLLTINLNDSYETILNNLMNVDDEAKYSEDSKNVFEEKYKKAIREIKKKENVIISVTYTERGRMYSFHEADSLYAIVDKAYKKIETRYEVNTKFNDRKKQ